MAIPSSQQLNIFAKLQASLASNWHPPYHDLDLATGRHLGLGISDICGNHRCNPKSVGPECGGAFSIPFPYPAAIKWR